MLSAIEVAAAFVSLVTKAFITVATALPASEPIGPRARLPSALRAFAFTVLGVRVPVSETVKDAAGVEVGALLLSLPPPPPLSPPPVGTVGVVVVAVKSDVRTLYP
jgi:hypothetical protein